MEIKYPINEIFFSLQGEGYNTGTECIFVRFAGCNFDCSWCDTDHRPRYYMTLDELVNALKPPVTTKKIVFTGGEPTIHNLQPLVKTLRKNGYYLLIESNGTGSTEIYNLFDYVTISPKTELMVSENGTPTNYVRMLENIFRNDQKAIDEVRIVVGEHTIKEQLTFFTELGDLSRKYLSPQYDNTTKSFNFQALYTFYEQMKDDDWHISIQTHKLAGIR